MKYMGSKARHGKEILDVIFNSVNKDDFEYWVEPFVGGANMIDKVKGLKRLGNDTNKYLIAMFKAVQDGWEPPDYVDEDQYKALSNCSDWYPESLVGFVGVGCSYSGKWFGGYARGNDNKGNPRNYCLESKKNLLAQNLKDIHFSSDDYRQMLIPAKSLIYCDPPYAGTTKYKSKFDSDTFWSWCDEQIAKGHQVFVSEYVAPSDWKEVWSKEVNNTLVKDTGSKKGVEKLFTKDLPTHPTSEISD